MGFVALSSSQSGMLLEGISFEYPGDGIIRHDRPTHEREET